MTQTSSPLEKHVLTKQDGTLQKINVVLDPNGWERESFDVNEKGISCPARSYGTESIDL